MPQLISVVMVIYSYFLIQTHLPHLPRCIPTHFNAAGDADAWGSPDTLWVLLGAQVLTCAAFLIVPYIGQWIPSAVHLGSRRLSSFSPAQRARIMPMLNNLAGYLSVVTNLFFVLMLREIMRVAGQPHPHSHMVWPLALLLGGMLGVILYYLREFSRAAREEGGAG
jgi:uncharacterized membrane protein